jgi:two-component system copper resistance phosphate regulon response regulator CusR
MRILLVESDKELLATIARGLAADRYAVDKANDGYRGLDCIETYSYDLILLDAMVSGLSGTLLLERIRSRNPLVPVLILSSSDSIDDKVRLFNIGADDHLTKPVAFAELCARAQALLRRSLPAPLNPSTVRVAGLELDRQRHQVRCKGKSIDLSNREFMLLDYLMRRPGSVYSPDLIVQKAWNRGLENKSNTVSVCIHKLRKKIGVDHYDGPIRTVPGMGYMIGGEETWETPLVSRDSFATPPCNSRASPGANYDFVAAADGTQHAPCVKEFSCGEGLRQSLGKVGCLAGKNNTASLEHRHLPRPSRPRFGAKLR